MEENSKTKSLVKFGDFSIEEAEREMMEMEKMSGSRDYMKLVVGRNIIRILPPKDAAGRSPFQLVMEHFLRLPGAQRPVVFACPTVTAKQRCPACEHAQRLRASGNPADRELAYDMSAKMRVYCNVINRKEPEKGPQILPIGKTIYEQLLSIRKDEDAGGNYSDPLNGFDIVIERKGTGKNDTEYAVHGSRKQSPLHTDAAQAEEWIATQADLSRFARSRSYDELLASIRKEGGMVGGGAGQAAPAPARPATRTAQSDLDDDDKLGF
jgi:gp32 DNA binding protein like